MSLGLLGFASALWCSVGQSELPEPGRCLHPGCGITSLWGEQNKRRAKLQEKQIQRVRAGTAFFGPFCPPWCDLWSYYCQCWCLIRQDQCNSRLGLLKLHYLYIYRCYWFYLVSLQHFFLGADVRSAGILFSCFALGAVMVAYFLAAILPADPVISFLPETFNLGSA